MIYIKKSTLNENLLKLEIFFYDYISHYNFLLLKL